MQNVEILDKEEQYCLLFSLSLIWITLCARSEDVHMDGTQWYFSCSWFWHLSVASLSLGRAQLKNIESSAVLGNSFPVLEDSCQGPQKQLPGLGEQLPAVQGNCCRVLGNSLTALGNSCPLHYPLIVLKSEIGINNHAGATQGCWDWAIFALVSQFVTVGRQVNNMYGTHDVQLLQCKLSSAYKRLLGLMIKKNILNEFSKS